MLCGVYWLIVNQIEFEGPQGDYEIVNAIALRLKGAIIVAFFRTLLGFIFLRVLAHA